MPNGEHARVDPDKVRDYLLNVAHPDSFGKASFFTAMDFNWPYLCDPPFKIQSTHSATLSTSLVLLGVRLDLKHWLAGQTYGQKNRLRIRSIYRF
ncbi:DUF6883 domain-containing protein [Candidatus Nitrospira salsa]